MVVNSMNKNSSQESTCELFYNIGILIWWALSPPYQFSVVPLRQNVVVIVNNLYS